MPGNYNNDDKNYKDVVIINGNNDKASLIQSIEPTELLNLNAKSVNSFNNSAKKNAANCDEQHRMKSF